MKITIPIRGPEYLSLEREYEHFLKDSEEFGNNNDLVKLIDNEPEYSNIKILKFSIIKSCEFKEKTDDRITQIRAKHSNFRTKYISEFLVIDAELKTDYAEKAYSSIFTNHLIQKLSLLIHISYATKVDFLEGVIYDKKEYLAGTKLLLSTIDFAYEHSDKMNWPRLNSIDIAKSVQWFSNNELHLDGNSKNKLQRSINAFSYSFSNLQEKDTSQLFWNMLGIESLLANGTNNISNQIRVKSSLILGEPKEYKKKLGKLYNYRSRFVHGDFDFPAKFSADFEVFEDEYWDYLSFSTSILLALIRKLIEKGKNEFDFEYKLIE
jgi:hypothetical protein